MVVSRYTMVLVVVDRFSKSCQFIPFNSLPSALHVAEALFQSMFRCYGLASILSDRGPQFISKDWKAVFHKVGVTVSLTSGYYPESNGQAERTIQELSSHLRQHSCEEFLVW